MPREKLASKRGQPSWPTLQLQLLEPHVLAVIMVKFGLDPPVCGQLEAAHGALRTLFRQDIDALHQVVQRDEQLGVAADRPFHRLQRTGELLQAYPSFPRLHGQEAVQSARVIAYAVGGDETAAPAHLLGEEDALRGVQFDFVLRAQREERPDGL